MNLPLKALDMDAILREIDRALTGSSGIQGMLQAVTRALHRRVSHYSWIGVYLIEGKDLVLRAYDGPSQTEHTKIPIGSGICGAAAESRQTIVVPDVSRDTRYLMCFPNTKSEIVVPIMDGKRVLGEIDVDSDVLNAFSEADRALLEEVARKLAAEIVTVATR